MKFIWEPSDIKVGRKYSEEGIEEVWMIGFRSDIAKSEGHYVSISMSDGMVTIPRTDEELANSLTEWEYIPLEFLER